MSLKPGQLPAPFYFELQNVLRAVNARNPSGEKCSYRNAVVNGLGLRDSFTSKIKDGSYKPTIDRLVNLSNLLEVEPTVFDSYVRRWAHEQVDTDPTFLEIFRILASQKESVQGLLKRGIRNHTLKLLEAAAPVAPKAVSTVRSVA